MDTLWDTMWIHYGVPCGVPYGVPYGVHCGDLGTLGGTLRTPGSSRETQERLKRDSRETQDSLKTVSRQSPQLPKHGSQRARWDRNHLTGIAAAATRSERGRPFSPTQECEQGEPFDVEGHRREGWDIQRHVIPHVTWHGKHCQAWQSSWNQVSNHEVMIPSHHHTSQSGPAGPAGPAEPSTLTILIITTLSEQLWRAVSSSNKAVSSSNTAVSSSQELSERVQTAPDGAVCTEEWRLPCHSPFFPCWVHGRLDSLLLFSLHASWKETA